jgi:hypothetical protein
MATATALLGPWPDLSTSPGGVIPAFVVSSAMDLQQGRVVVIIIILNIRCGGHLCHRVPVLGVATHHNQNCIYLLRLVLWPFCFLLRLHFEGGPRWHTMARAPR